MMEQQCYYLPKHEQLEAFKFIYYQEALWLFMQSMPLSVRLGAL